VKTYLKRRKANVEFDGWQTSLGSGDRLAYFGESQVAEPDPMFPQNPFVFHVRRNSRANRVSCDDELDRLSDRGHNARQQYMLTENEKV